MILADSSIWIDFFRSGNPMMQKHLLNKEIVTHGFVAAELALGTLLDRRKTLADLDRLPQVPIARLDEVRSMIEAHSLFFRGIGFTDVHLIASCRLAPGTRLWTRDVRLASAARHTGVAVYRKP